MKFAHLADAHIGSWRDPKLKDLSLDSFVRAIDASIQENVDFILSSGDLFNTALPSIDHVRLVVRKLKEAKEKNIPFYFIAGSHDFSPSGKTMLDIIEEAGLGINVMKGTVDDAGNLCLDFVENVKTGAKITGILGKKGMLDKKDYAGLDKSKLESERGFKIFMFHTSLDEMKPDYMDAMESFPVEFLPKNFNYYAGGHVHIVEKKDFSKQGYNNVVYPGPTFPANFSELEKLKTGGFFIYDNGKIIRKEIKVRDSISMLFNVEEKTSAQALEMISEKLKTINPHDKIILIRIYGKLSSGKPSDLRLNSAIEELHRKGAYFVMKNTSKLSAQDFSEVKEEQAGPDEIEEKIISAHLNQIANDFHDEKDTTKRLMKVFSEEKHEAEKNSDYESRIRKNADEIFRN